MPGVETTSPVGLRLGMLLVAGLLGLVTGLPSKAQAHLGGEIVRPVFIAPADDIVVLDGDGDGDGGGMVTVAWLDPDEDPTGRLDFYVTTGNIPPSAELSTRYFSEGALIGSAPVSDPTDALAWDTSTLGPGVYTLFALSVDPPLCDVATPAPGTLVVPDPSADLPFLAGHWTAPDAASNSAIAGKTNLRMEAQSATAPRMTLELGRIDPAVEGPEEDPCRVVGVFNPRVIIASDVVGEADPGSGPNRWTLRYFWDPAGLLPGRYVIRATLTNDNGQTHTLFTPVELPISGSPTGPELGPEAPPDGPQDTGAEGQEDVSGSNTDLTDGDATAISPPSTQPADGCATAHGPQGWAGLAGICFIMGLGLSRRRRAISAR